RAGACRSHSASCCFSEHEVLRLWRVSQGSDAGFEQPERAVRYGRSASNEAGFHHRGLAYHGEQAATGIEALRELVRHDRDRASEDDRIIWLLLFPAAGGLPRFQRGVENAAMGELG